MKRLLICVLALALLAGCAPASVQEPEDGKLHIVATVFPAYDFARAAAGDLWNYCCRRGRRAIPMNPLRRIF